MLLIYWANDLLGTEAPKDGYSAGLFALGILQVSAAVGAIVFAAWRVMKSYSMREDAVMLDKPLLIS